MRIDNERFWLALDTLLARSEVIIDRPKGKPHPKMPDLIYPVDYGYLKDTRSPDGDGVDVYIGSGDAGIDAVICTVDLYKNDSEIKLLVGCTEAEKAEIFELYSERYDTLQGVMIRRPEFWVKPTQISDMPAWRRAAADVADIFGNPVMADDPEFIGYAERKIAQNEALVAFCGGEPVGFIGFSRRFNRITWLGVLDAHRGRGLGSALLKAAIAELDATREIAVETFRESFAPGRAARRAYMKHGFVEARADLFDHLGNERCLLIRAARGK